MRGADNNHTLTSNMRILEHDQLRNFFYELTSNFLFVIVYVIRFEYIIFYRLRSHQ